QYLERCTQPLGDRLGRLDVLAPDIDHADLYRFARQHLQYGSRQAGFCQFQRVLGDTPPGKRRQYLVVAMFPLLAPVLPGPVAVTSMDAAHHARPFKGSVHGFHTPRVQLVRQSRDRGFVELDDLAAGGRERTYLLVQRVCEGERQGALVTVILVVGAIYQGRRTRQCHLDRLAGQPAQEMIILERVVRAQRDRPDYARNFLGGLAPPHRFGPQGGEIDAFQVRQEVAVMAWTALLAVADDVDAGAVLVGQRQP